MSPFVIRSAAPFGYLLLGAMLLFLGVVGLTLVGQGLWRRRYRRAGVGLALGLLVTYVIWINVVQEGRLDYNPRVGVATLSGRWKHGDAVLLLRANGRYQCSGAAECEELGALGTWTVDEFDVTLVSAHSSTAQDKPLGARYRVVSYDGVLRLASPIDEDPDMWDGKFFWAFGAPAT